MAAWLIASFIIGYFVVLIGISYFTGKSDDNEAFFKGNNSSPWYIVAFGMIGASLSGVTFISVPGWVGNEANQFSYMQAVLGYFVGYLIVAYVLLPIYYKLNLTSIYEYLKQRFGFWSYKTGSGFFFLSRVLGASVRLLLVSNVLQKILFNDWGIPFEATVVISILLIWIYTNKGGIKTIIWTDTLQTAFMLTSVIVTVWLISDVLNLSEQGGTIKAISSSSYSQIFFFDDIMGSNHFLKHFLGGMFITIGMTGLDQDMMQKNLTCKNIKEAQKNMLSLAAVLVVVNLVFLGLGALLFMYAESTGIGEGIASDLLFAEIAMHENTGTFIGILFLLGLIAAAYSSADSALTSLTTSFSVDFLNLESRSDIEQNKLRKAVHIAISVVLVLVVILLKYTTSQSAIGLLMKFAGFTYGPLIGLFFFGIITKRTIRDNLVLPVSLLVPAIIGIFWFYSTGAPGIEKGQLGIFGSYRFGFEIIIYNAVLAFFSFFCISRKAQ